MSKLSLYLVTFYPRREDDDHVIREATGLVIAEHATDIDSEMVGGTVNEVGRLGDYDPGITGHRMVMSRPRLIVEDL